MAKTSIAAMKTSEFSKLSFDEILGASVSETDTPELREIPYEQIKTNEANFYTVDDVRELADSIALHGLLDPVVVTPDGEDFLLISGHRRFKAWGQLREADPDRYAAIPAIVRIFPSKAMAELALIMANATSRKLTSVEIGRQAQRIERLLYDLKEEGYTFPGRMRDQVAKACQVSASKLARLKVIENGLTGIWATIYEKNGIPEETAYQLARLSPEIQTKIMRATDKPGAYGVEIVGKLMAEEGVTYDGTQLKLGCDRCTHGDAFLRHDLEEPRCACKGETCCLRCERAKRDWSPCSRMCGKAKAVRSEAAKAEKDKAEKERKAKENKTRKLIRERAARLLKAAEAAELSDDKVIPCGNGWRSRSVGWIRKAAGDGEIGSIYDNDLSPNDIDVPKAARILGCSADYICGLTEDLHPKAEAPGQTFEPWWQKGDPETDGRYLCLVDMNRSGYPDVHEQMLDRTGGEWLAYGRGIGDMFEVVAWYALPPHWNTPARRPEEKNEEEP